MTLIVKIIFVYSVLISAFIICV